MLGRAPRICDIHVPLTAHQLQEYICRYIFIIYVNDVPKEIRRSSPDSHTAGFADDTQTLNQGTKQEVTAMTHATKAGIVTARQSFGGRGLKMNAIKTQLMLCGTRQSLSSVPTPEITIDNDTLACAPAVKDLGINLDQHMTFSCHVDHLVKQMCGILCFISRNRYFLTVGATRLLVESLVLSRLSYCSAVWGGIGQTQITRLQRVVNFGARVIFNKKKHEPVTPLLKELRWLSVQNRLLLDTATFMFKVAHGLVPETITSLFTRVSTISERHTRQVNDFYVPRARTEDGKRALSYRGAKVWNSVPTNLKCCSNPKTFRKSYRLVLLDIQYSIG